MKYTVLIVLALLLGCHKEIDPKYLRYPYQACGVKVPTQELPWLKKLIAKADSDKSYGTYQGNYLGVIYLQYFQDMEVFYTDMLLNTTSRQHAFYCDGSPVVFDSITGPVFFNNITQGGFYYTNK